MVFGRRRGLPSTPNVASVSGNATLPSSHVQSKSQLSEINKSPIKCALEDLLNIYFPAEERMAAIVRARTVFDHDNTHRHNEELMVHAVVGGLFVKLAFAIKTRASVEEVRRLCELLELVICRADLHAIEDCFDDVGREALPLLTTVLQMPFQSTDASIPADEEIRVVPSKVDYEREKTLQRKGWSASEELKMATQSVCSVLSKFSLLNGASHCMAIEPRLVPSLILVMDVSHGMTNKARYSALAVLSNLAQNGGSDTRVVLASHPSLMESVAKMALPYEALISRKAAALTLMFLTYGNDEHIPLVFAFTDLENAHVDFSVLDTWIALLIDSDYQVRRYTVFGLYNTACGDENTLLMVSHRNGAVLEALILNATLEEEDAELRVLCLEIIYNLSCSALLEVHSRICSHPGLLMTLASFLRFREQSPLAAKETSACILHRLAQVVNLEQMAECQQVLISALVLGSSWKRTPDIARAFDLQSADNPEGIAKQSGLLDGLSALALIVGEGENERHIRAAAVSSIVRLATPEINRKLLANHEGIMLALTRASFDHPITNNEYPIECEGFLYQLDNVNSILKELVLEMNAQPEAENEILGEPNQGKRKPTPLLLLTQFPSNFDG